ncbi:MAG: imidazole glycerol phosphate synthase subunit HisH [Kiritimatiellaceae bacterium]|jgi:glutamine amidotransferase|nr:imidazole glycerol phosphate synthase subunit HisH [Kiritimatiellaceae bacterium]|tara:strand:- start:124 stop:744 length:621 start_codon:yes stop_codon:yes gene_type:complete
MIGVIDYGMGNLGSVVNALRYLEQDVRLIERREEADRCDALILPGVGAFGDCMEHLEAHGFVELIREWVAAGRPLMGICLGLQALFAASEESPGVAGLSLFEGTVKRFDLPADLKVPQIGWNRVEAVQPDCPMFTGIEPNAHFYLVHSFYVDTPDSGLIAGKTNYGIDYCSCIWRDNVFATQFHPEKSQAVGLQMLKNFADWSAGV